jgi:quinol-cytochrome oxidoreductase complex cytochrome b subunit
VGSNIMASTPFIGEKMRYVLLGGNTVNANALTRFYVLHAVILPLGVVVLVSIHFWRLHKDGGMFSPDEKEPEERP